MRVCIIYVRTYDFNSANRWIRGSFVSFGKGSGPGPSAHDHRTAFGGWYEKLLSSLLGRALSIVVVVVVEQVYGGGCCCSVSILHSNTGEFVRFGVRRRKHGKNACRTKTEREKRRKENVIYCSALFFINKKKKKEEIFLIRLSGLVRGPHTTLLLPEGSGGGGGGGTLENNYTHAHRRTLHAHRPARGC